MNSSGILLGYCQAVVWTAEGAKCVSTRLSVNPADLSSSPTVGAVSFKQDICVGPLQCILLFYFIFYHQVQVLSVLVTSLVYLTAGGLTLRYQCDHEVGCICGFY